MKRAVGVMLAVGAVLAAGCGTAAPTRSPEQGPAGMDAFPVTVEHALGSTTIPGKPQRIVTLGGSDADVVLALGQIPVAIRTLYNFPRGVGRWAEDELGDAAPQVMPREISYEAIAAVRPDLILDVSSTGDPEKYSTLAKIAPTVALPKGPPAPRWEDSTRLIARALGLSQQGDDLVTKTNDYLAGIAAANPGFAGKTLTYLDLYGNQVYFGGRSATTITTIGALGFTPTEFVRNFPEDKRQNAISHELLSKVDADVVLAYSIGTTPENAQKAIPALKDLRAVQENRFQYLPDLSLSAPSVLSIPHGVDNLLPFLQRATAA